MANREQQKDLDAAIEEKRNHLNSLKCHKMPRTLEIFNHLPRSWKRVIYARGYLQFNNAVHIDLASLGERIVQEGDTAVISFDSEDNPSQLAQYCLGFTYTVLYLVREHFGLDTKQMREDFKHIGSAELSPEQ